MKLNRVVFSYTIKITDESFDFGNDRKFEQTARITFRDSNKNIIEKRKYGVIDIDALSESINKGDNIDLTHCYIGNFSSNDYLGITPSKIRYTQFQSSSRLVSGNDSSFSILEKKLSKHKSQEKTIVYPTGYMANIGVISTLASKQDTIFSDELNHASIVEACKLSSAKIKIFKHYGINS